ncbi:MAG: PDZ domain-containing protein [Desulfobacteraceae bacterium]|nr:PDZ domain-containing protein [Desulfobacteraceae bacterium]
MIKRYFTLANMLLVAVISYLGVQIFYQSLMAQLDSGVGISAQSGAAVNPVADTRMPINQYDAITQRDLFKTKAAEDAIAAAAAAAIKKEQTPVGQPMEQTKLQVRLWGTVFSEGAASYAVIEDLKDKKQSLYRIDDKIQIATVKQILREKVILNSNGKDEVLDMEDKTPPATNKAIFPPVPMGEAQPPSPSESENVKLSRSDIQESISDMNNLMKQARIRPHFTDGKPDGLTVTGVRPDSIFTKLGLQSGDIITGVDGREIQSVDDALRLYQSLKSSSNVSVQIKRRGEQKSMDYSIE